VIDLRARLEQIEDRLIELDPIEDHTQILLLIGEAIQLDRILQVQESINQDMLDFMIKEGLITIKQKKEIKINWDDLDPGVIGK
jgi:hypothetical protein